MIVLNKLLLEYLKKSLAEKYYYEFTAFFQTFKCIISEKLLFKFLP